MALTLTAAARAASRQVNVKPQMVFSIDGIPTKFGLVKIYKYIRIGDPGLYINNINGQPWFIGGFSLLEDQGDYVSFEKGTTSRLTQQLQPDKGIGSSAANMLIAVIDKNELVSEMISPGFIVDEILGRECKIEMGFLGTSYPEDFWVMFRGVIEDIDAGAGIIRFSTSNAEQKKRQKLFPRLSAKLTKYVDINEASDTVNLVAHGYSANEAVAFSNITGVPDTEVAEDVTYYVKNPTADTFQLSTSPGGVVINITVSGNAYLAIPSEGSFSVIHFDTDPGFQTKMLGPDLTYDPAIDFYVQIGEEIFHYTGVSGTKLTGVSRAQFNSVAASHAADSVIDSIVWLQDNGINLCLKIMLSGWNDYFKEDFEIKNFLRVGSSDIENAIYFDGVDIERDFGLTVGDYITTSGSAYGANNVTMKTISEVVKVETGSYIVVDGVSFVLDLDTTALISFRSKYDTLGYGLKMKPYDVDVEEHERLYRLFLSSFDYEFYVKDGGDGKDFLEQEIYRPMTMYSIPRKGRASAGYHIGPIPGSQLVILNQSNVTNADKLRIRRSVSQNFANTVITKYDLNPVTDSYDSVSNIDRDASLDAIQVGPRTITLNSGGLRTDLQAASRINSASNRLLNRYAFGAEFIDDVQVLFGTGIPIEIGDMVIVDLKDLKITDTDMGSRRNGSKRFFEVLNKTIDIPRGIISLKLVDTRYDTAARYGLISPASFVKSGVSDTVFNIRSSFSSVYGDNEYLKWGRLGQIYVRVCSSDYTTRNAIAQIDHFSGNQVTMASSLGFTPQPDDLMVFAPYNYANEYQKLVYAYMRDAATFDDGKPQFRML